MPVVWIETERPHRSRSHGDRAARQPRDVDVVELTVEAIQGLEGLAKLAVAPA